MSEQKLVTLAQLRRFLEGTTEVEFRGCGKDEDRYRHIGAVLRRLADLALLADTNGARQGSCRLSHAANG